MRHSLVRLNVIALALCAVMLRGLLPAGWMPDTGHAGAGLVICTADGLRHIHAPQHQGKNDPSSKHDGDLCPFAATAHFAALQSPPQLIPMGFAIFYPAPLPAYRSHETRVADHDHAARAPPSLA